MSYDIDIDAEPKRPRPLPPLIGTPPPPVKDRPLCPGCSRPLRPYLEAHWEIEPDGTRQLGASHREWKGRYHGRANIFCGTECAAQYAISEVRNIRGLGGREARYRYEKAR
jgi:hypothetical protein